jgi:hypothetical protein
MNKVLQAKLRKLTMYYNSLDFLAETPGAEETEKSKIRTELERLFFDKDDPLLTSSMVVRLLDGTDAFAAQVAKLEADVAAIEDINNNIALKAAALLAGRDLDAEIGALNATTARLEALATNPICTIYSPMPPEEGLVHNLLGNCFATQVFTDLILDRTIVKSTLNTSDMSRFGDTPDKLNTSLTFVQMHSNVTSPIRRNASILESYMNYIPNIERSKCVPDLKVKFLTKQNVSTSNNLEQLAVLNFLNGPGVPQEGSAELLFTQASKNKIDSGLSENRSVTKHGMEMFTMPQTLRGHVSDSTPLSDPFRPLMSLDGVSIDIYPAGEGFIAYKQATLDFTLFDRTRLKDISFLLDPSRYGNTIIEIDAGWNHPDDSTPYGAILSAMRIKDAYQIKKANFSMKGSSTFNIKVDVAMLGGSDIFNKNVFSVGASSHVRTLRDLVAERREILSDYQALTNALKGADPPNTRLLPESIVRRQGDDESVLELLPDSLEKILAGKSALRSLILAAKGDDEKITLLGSQLDTLNDIGIELNSPSNPITLYETIVKGSIDDFKRLMLSTTGDPFLVGEGTSSTTHISFGKLFVNLCVLPIVDSSTTDHIHIIMYNFNKYAAKMGYVGAQSGDNEKHNLSTFAFKQSDVIKHLTKHLSTKYFIAPQDVIAYARGAMSNRINEQYGIVNSANGLNDLQGTRRTLQNTVTTSRQSLSDLTSDPGQTSTGNFKPLRAAIDPPNPGTVSFEDEHARLTSLISSSQAAIDELETRIGEGLKQASEDAMEAMGTYKIQMPDLKLFVETTTSNGQTLVRFHVYDANEAPYELHEIAANMGIIQGETRLDDNEQTVNLFNQLKAGNFIIDVPGNENVKAHQALNIRNLDLKKAIKNNMPSITYGTEATAINSISLNTISDSNINTHFLLETRQKEEDDKDDPAPVTEPEETLQSAKDAKIIVPVTMTIDMLGCPAIGFAQQMFIDLGTGTDLDNVYAAIDVTHKLKPGSFKTTVKMSPTFSGKSVTFSDMISDIIAANARLHVEPEAN